MERGREGECTNELRTDVNYVKYTWPFRNGRTDAPLLNFPTLPSAHPILRHMRRRNEINI